MEFEFRYEDLKKYIQFNSFCRQVDVWMLLKLTEKIIQEKAFEQKKKKPRLRWLDWIFWGGYLPSLSINYVATSKDVGKRLPQLYYIKMKISYHLGFIAIRVAVAT